MNNKQYVNYGRKRKSKKLLIIICCCAAVFLIAVGVVGIIAGSSGEERQEVSAAVSENIELKQQMSGMQEKIDGLNQRIAELENELEQRPTISPTPYAVPGQPSMSPVPSEQTVPRERIRN